MTNEDPAPQRPVPHAPDMTDEQQPAERPLGESQEDLRAELEAERARAADYLEQWQRAAAEFQNYRRRSEREREQTMKRLNARLIKALLPVLDNLERALRVLPEDVRQQSWVQGMRLIERQFRSTLEREGLSAIDTVGQRFDPGLHQAAGRQEPEDELGEDVVVEELQPGYRLYEEVLRPSTVKVARRNPDERQSTGAGPADRQPRT